MVITVVVWGWVCDVLLLAYLCLFGCLLLFVLRLV